MIEFKSVFKSELESYVSMREKSVTHSSFLCDVRILRSFDDFLASLNLTERCVTEETVSAWMRKDRNERDLADRTFADQLCYLRNFLRYLQFFGVPVFLPTYPKITYYNYVPYLFSDEEIEIIIREADKQADRNGSAFRAMPMILRMLIGCGFRIGELLNVHIRDIDFVNKTILLKKTKNNKQRIVPMSESLSGILRKYCKAEKLLGQMGSWLFPSRNHEKHICTTAVETRFVDLLKSTGIYVKPEPHTRGQCIHCLRHAFTVRAFARGEKAGITPMNSVPYLSVFLGHFDMDGTERYLKFSGDMFPEYSQAFESYADGVFSEVAYEE